MEIRFDVLSHPFFHSDFVNPETPECLSPFPFPPPSSNETFLSFGPQAFVPEVEAVAESPTKSMMSL